MRKLAPSKNSPRSSVSGIFTTITLQKSAFALGRVWTVGLFTTYVTTGGSPNYAILTNAVFSYAIFHRGAVLVEFLPKLHCRKVHFGFGFCLKLMQGMLSIN